MNKDLAIIENNIRRIAQILEEPQYAPFFLFFVKRNWTGEQEQQFFTLCNILDQILLHKLEKWYTGKFTPFKLKLLNKVGEEHRFNIAEFKERTCSFLNNELLTIFKSDRKILDQIKEINYSNLGYNNFLKIVQLIDSKDLNPDLIEDEIKAVKASNLSDCDKDSKILELAIKKNSNLSLFFDETYLTKVSKHNFAFKRLFKKLLKDYRKIQAAARLK